MFIRPHVVRERKSEFRANFSAILISLLFNHTLHREPRGRPGHQGPIRILTADAVYRLHIALLPPTFPGGPVKKELISWQTK